VKIGDSKAPWVMMLYMTTRIAAVETGLMKE
jgi:hypothetical protein